MSQDITPFTLSIAQTELEDLYHRIDMTRWPEDATVDDWSQGVPLGAMRELVDYWRHDYDWRPCERRLNELGQYKTTIDGVEIHFLHARSPYEDALPLVLTHGWPGSVREFLDLVPRLTHPEDHGGSAADAFHVVVPSLPGYGFSGKPTEAGWGVGRIGAAWAELMGRLGYERWVAQGGDWGGIVTCAIGVLAPDGCAAIHTNMPFAPPPDNVLTAPTDEDLQAMARGKDYQDNGSGYSKQQSTKPQTVGYSLVDSPVGLAAWIFEKMHAWTDNAGSPFDALSRDAILDNIMIYWLSETGASSARLYWESYGGAMATVTIGVPVGVSQFPEEIVPTPRTWFEKVAPQITYWNKAEKGGHFAAWEQPDLFARELRAWRKTVPEQA